MRIYKRLRFEMVELAFRVNLSMAFLSYGYSKIAGTMFNNSFSNMSDLKLSQIDSFHLTWYWFNQNKELSILIGIMQIVSALLLVYNRTKLIGALIYLPIISGILMIDIFCAQSAGLIGRVSFYLCVCIAILAINYKKLIRLLILPEHINQKISTNQTIIREKAIDFCQFILFLIIALAVETLSVAIFNVCHKTIS